MATQSFFDVRTGFTNRWMLRLVIFVLMSAIGSFAVARQEPSQEKVAVWHPLVLSFDGPSTSEDATPNPFTDYRLTVTFQNRTSGKRYVVRGFYAADGNAANTGADSGKTWQVRFAPDAAGLWSYSAALRQGSMIAIDDRPDAGTSIEISNSVGELLVTPTPLDLPADQARDFRNRGRVFVDKGYFRIGDEKTYWLKGGADSPENLLAFADFDGTFRMSEKAREGENDPGESLHRFPQHRADWRDGDPTWKTDQGKSIIGAINYLASVKMNACYFLTLNIEGDGKDVWPYAQPEDFTRFDCSKLDQWEIVFSHMQRQGILIHLVTQETENEKLLDRGDTGAMRKLYYRELIARFAHHPALVWNLGEENGPADFSPDGQTAEQQKAMASEIKHADPYRHPVVIHTHAARQPKQDVLTDLLGFKPIDGLSFQVDQPRRVHAEIIEWKTKAVDSGRPWLIAMDEIGKWDTGVVPDSVDADHDELRHQVLWGGLMAGAAGVEWYFGANYPHNDLSSEDWRQRENMWKQTHVALEFFERHLPYWEMEPQDELTTATDDYCFAKSGQVYAVYLPPRQPDQATLPNQIDLESSASSFDVQWLNAKQGGRLQAGSVSEIQGPGVQDLGNPPHLDRQDWVVLIKRKER